MKINMAAKSIADFENMTQIVEGIDADNHQDLLVEVEESEEPHLVAFIEQVRQYPIKR